MGNKNYEIRTCTLDKENKTVFIGKRQFVLSVKKVQVTYYEKEDAGGGWYWKGKGEKKQAVRTDYHVYDLSSNYIGEIGDFTQAHFMNPNTQQLKVPLTSLQYLLN